VLADRGRAIFLLADRVSQGCVDGMTNVFLRCNYAVSSVKRALFAGQASVETSERERAAMKDEAPPGPFPASRPKY
jgi:hypothetical protein